MIKNNKQKYKILNYKKSKRYIIRSGIILTTLFLSFSQNIKASTINNIEDEEIECYSMQRDAELEELIDEMNIEDFDKNFLNIIENGKLIYNNQEYELKTLQLKQLEDKSNHLTCYFDTTHDILTGEDIGYNWEKLSQFENSSVYYQMYKDGIITSATTNINESNKELIEQYINKWNGEEHDQSPLTRANKELKEKEEEAKRYKKATKSY